jgi:rod shape-determining protein MreD
MKKLFFLIGLVILATLQLTWPVSLSFFNCKPDLLLIFTLAVVFSLDFKIALVFSVLAGLTKDAFLPSPLALNTILFSMWSYLVYLLSRQISTDNDYVRLAVVLVVALLNNIIIGLQSVNSGDFIPLGIFLRNLITTSIYTAALSPLIFKLTKKLTA